MSYIIAFLRFWYDFLVGDDWRIAAGILIVLGLTAGAAHWFNATAAAAVIVLGVLIVEGDALRRSARS